MTYPKFYTFNINRRVYDGKVLGARTIYAEHFQEIIVESENEKEYITNRGTINKRSMKLAHKWGGRDRYAVYTEAERAAMIWNNENRHKLMRVVDQCKDVEILKQIAQLVGYIEGK